jgi:6-phosphogluconate dehydrogenase
MDIGMIGLGRMGGNMVRRLMHGGHTCVVYDRSADSVRALAGEGASGVTSLDDFIAKLTTPRVVWLMVPAAAVDAALADLEPRRATSSSTAETPSTATISTARSASRRQASTTSTAARVAACGDSSAGIA